MCGVAQFTSRLMTLGAKPINGGTFCVTNLWLGLSLLLTPPESSLKSSDLCIDSGSLRVWLGVSIYRRHLGRASNLILTSQELYVVVCPIR